MLICDILKLNLSFYTSKIRNYKLGLFLKKVEIFIHLFFEIFNQLTFTNINGTFLPIQFFFLIFTERYPEHCHNLVTKYI